MNVNKAIIVGRLTRDPEIRTTAGGKTVASLSLATTSTWMDKGTNQRQEQTEFHNVVLWGRTAEIAGHYLVKGQEAFVEGRIQTRAYTAKDGTERRVTEIIADTLQLGAKPQGAPSGARPYVANRPVTAPSAPPYTQATPGTAASSQAAPAPKREMPIEEIPTINLDDEKEDVRIEDVPF